MKNNIIARFLMAMLPFVAIACDDNIPELGTVNNLKVEKVVLDDELSEGVEIIAGKTLSISEHISAFPDKATNTAQRYESSDPSVADVSEDGILAANKVGDCVITVYVGMDGVCEDFTVKVLPVPDITISNIAFVGMSAEYQLLDGMTLTLDLNTKVSVSPEDYSEKLVFSSSSQDVASIDEGGILTIHKTGETTITASAANHPLISATHNLRVVPLEKAEWDRTSWTMTCSQDPLPNPGGRNNSLTAMFDGKPIVNRIGKNDDSQSNGTAFCIDVPGKNSLKNLTGDAINSHEISFTIDLKQSLPVNWFRISNISGHKDDVAVRFKGFTEISGSNDGKTFEIIEQNLDFTNKQNVKVDDTPTYNRETENIHIKFSQYRYLKFMMRGLSCYGPLGKTGGTAQIEEFYLGYDKDLENAPEPVEVNVSSLAFTVTEKEYELASQTAPIDISSLVTVLPADHTEGIIFESSDPETASVSPDGMLTLHKLTSGVTLTVRAANHPEVSSALTVKAFKYVGMDYPRFAGEGTASPSEPREFLMSMTCSQDPLVRGGLVNGRNNSWTAMLDGKHIAQRSGASDDDALTNGTAFCIVCPGKKTGNVDLSGVDKEKHEIYFTIDLGPAKPVNYFRVRNISDNADDMVVRFKGFTEISGSNDGNNFKTIMKDVDFSEQQKVETGMNGTKKTYNIETANIPINEAEYRYLRFMVRGLGCFGPLGRTGTSAQIDEFYLGYTNSKVYAE